MANLPFHVTKKRMWAMQIESCQFRNKELVTEMQDIFKIGFQLHTGTPQVHVFISFILRKARVVVSVPCNKLIQEILRHS